MSTEAATPAKRPVSNTESSPGKRAKYASPEFGPSVNGTYCDPRADLHLVTTDKVVFKIHMFTFAPFCGLLADMFSLRPVLASGLTAATGTDVQLGGSLPPELHVPASEECLLLSLNLLVLHSIKPPLEHSRHSISIAKEMLDLGDILQCEVLVDEARAALMEQVDGAGLLVLAAGHHDDEALIRKSLKKLVADDGVPSAASLRKLRKPYLVQLFQMSHHFIRFGRERRVVQDFLQTSADNFVKAVKGNEGE